MSSPYLFVALICFISLLSLWFSGNSSCSVCNIKPIHPSVKCPLTSPLSHTRSISRWFQSHKVALSKSCFGRRTTEECVQHRHAHSITNTHRHAQAQCCTDSQKHSTSRLTVSETLCPAIVIATIHIFPVSSLFSSFRLRLFFLLLPLQRNWHKCLHAALLVWEEKRGLTPRKEEGWRDFWRQLSRPQLMENRCGRKRGGEELRATASTDAPSSNAVSEMAYKVAVCGSMSLVWGHVVFQTNRVCESSCRDFDLTEYCWSWSSSVVPSVPESDSDHLQF